LSQLFSFGSRFLDGIANINISSLPVLPKVIVLYAINDRADVGVMPSQDTLFQLLAHRACAEHVCAPAKPFFDVSKLTHFNHVLI
jgi:hypothetical protein